MNMIGRARAGLSAVRTHDQGFIAHAPGANAIDRSAYQSGKVPLAFG
jgi:hypothetical protein